MLRTSSRTVLQKGHYNVKQSKTLYPSRTVLVAGTTLAFTGCGTTSQQNTQTAQAIASWSETFDGATTNFSVSAPPTHAVSMSQATTEMMLQLGLSDKMAGTAFRGRNLWTFTR